MALNQVRIWRGDPQFHNGQLVRFVCLSNGDHRVNLGFTPEKVREPRFVRRMIYEAQRNHFPDYQRLIPRRRRATWH